MHTYILCTLYMGLLYPLLYPWYVTIILMYNVHPCFSLRNLGKKVHIIHGNVWYLGKIVKAKKPKKTK